MLIVHPASTCDVCLEGYTGRSENLPHSISCGHVFCLNCLRSLRQHNCPLCRTPFEASDVRRLHIDRNDLLRTPSPHRFDDQRPKIPADNSLGLFNDDLPRSAQLQNKLSDFVLKELNPDASKLGVSGLLQEIHAFLSVEPSESIKYRELSDEAFSLRTERNRDRQTFIELERRFKDIQRSRARDQESARTVEESLRERLKIEELEWQRKYDYVSEECAKLRDELDELRLRNPLPRSTPTSQVYFLATENGMRPTGGFNFDRSTGHTRRANIDDDMYTLFNPDLFRGSPMPGAVSMPMSKRDSDSSDRSYDKQRRKEFENLGRTSPVASSISRASDSAAALSSRAVSPVPPIQGLPNRQRSDSNPINGSRSEKPRFRYDEQSEVSSSLPSSYMYRSNSPTRTLFPATPRPTELVTRSDVVDNPEVMRLYSLLEKPVPVSVSVTVPAEDSRVAVGSGASGSYTKERMPGPDDQNDKRPSLLRSTSAQPARSIYSNSNSNANMEPFAYLVNPSSSPSHSPNRPSTLRRTQTNLQSQTSLLSQSQPRATQPQPHPQLQVPYYSFTQDQLPSPVQRTPPRPVPPPMHSSALHGPNKPVSPQENRIAARGLPRRGSLSSASAAAAAQASSQDHEPSNAQGSNVHGRRGVSTGLAATATTAAVMGGSSAFVPPSSLGGGKTHVHVRGLFGGPQDSN